MRRVIGLIVAVAVLVVAAIGTAGSASRVFVDGREVVPGGGELVMVANNRVYVDASLLSQALGAQLTWDANQQHLLITSWRQQARSQGVPLLWVDAMNPALDMAKIASAGGGADGVALAFDKFILISGTSDFGDYAAKRIGNDTLIQRSLTFHLDAEASNRPPVPVYSQSCDSIRATVATQRDEALAAARRAFASRNTLHSSMYQQEVERITTYWTGVLRGYGCQ